ncbi:MAG: flagellar export protein FliJ [Candidatus Gastranaerophilaceae bacterium]
MINMPFRYRLQKILDFRINQKEEQRMRVQKAQQAVNEAEQNIKKNNQDILDTKEGMRTADPRMYESYDNFLNHLWEKAEQLEKKRQELQEVLDAEVAKLVKCEQAVKVLEKHKEKNKELYLAEEKAAELKQFSELGVTRFFKQAQERRDEEEQQEILRQLREIEGN